MTTANCCIVFWQAPVATVVFSSSSHNTCHVAGKIRRDGGTDTVITVYSFQGTHWDIPQPSGTVPKIRDCSPGSRKVGRYVTI